MLDNPFYGLDVATLTTLKTKTLEAIQAVLLNQSYSLNGKSVSRAYFGSTQSDARHDCGCD